MLNENEIIQATLDVMPALRAMFAKFGLPDDQIDDAVQNGCMHLITYALPRWRGDGSLHTFCLQSVKRRWLDETRSSAYKARRKQAKPLPDGTEPLSLIADESTWAAAERAVEAHWIRQILRRLTGREKALCLAYQRTGSWRLAGDAIGVSMPTVSRIKERIRAKFREEGEEE